MKTYERYAIQPITKDFNHTKQVDHALRVPYRRVEVTVPQQNQIGRSQELRWERPDKPG